MAGLIPAVTFAKDRFGYLRRTCPDCRRHFKSRPNGEEAVAIHRYLSERFSHCNAHEAEGGPALFHCIYCGHADAPEDFFTEEQRVYLDQVAEALTREIRFQQLSYVQRTLSQNPSPTFVTVRPAETMPRMAPEDVAEGRPVEFTCCGEETIAIERWESGFQCPACGRGEPDLMASARELV